MKKFFMMAVMAVAALSASAQYEPAKGDFGTQVTFSPFKDNTNTLENNYGVTARYFLSDKDAIRAKLTFGYNNEKDHAEDLFSGVETMTSATLFGIAAGYERHFASNGRIDLYVGGELGFGTTWTNNKADEYGYGYSESVEIKNKDAQTTMNVAAFTGINFYIYKKLFVGAELNFSYNHGWGKDTQYTYTNNVYSFSYSAANNKTTNALGFHVTPEVSLGWTF